MLTEITKCHALTIKCGSECSSTPTQAYLYLLQMKNTKGNKRAMDSGFCGKMKRNRQLGRPWRRWDGNIKTSVKEIESDYDT